MTALIHSTKRHVAQLISNTVLDCLGDDEVSKGEDIHQFFLSFVNQTESFIDYDFNTRISEKEFNGRDLTRYLTDTQRFNINRSAYTNCSAKKINEFVLKLKNGHVAEMAKDIEHCHLYPLYALIAHLKRGDVQLAQVISSCLLYQGIKQFITDFRVILNYQPANSANTTGFVCPALIMTNFSASLPAPQTYSIFENSTFIKQFFNLTDEQVEILIASLKFKPLSERYYHVIDLPMLPVHAWSPGHHRVVQVIMRLMPVEIGSSVSFLGQSRFVMVIPSYSMFTECAKALYGKDAMTYVPILGICTEKVIMALKRLDKCAFHVGMQEADVPDEADGFWFGKLLYSFHDWYHGLRGAMIGKNGRKAILFIAWYLLQRLNRDSSQIQWTLMDGELWKSDQYFGHLFRFTNIPWDETSVLSILRHMAMLPEFWKEEFEILPTMLFPQELSKYERILSTITPEERRQAQVDLFYYYKATARDDNPDAQFRLGNFYFKGEGTDISYADAIKHWKLCGHGHALFSISLCYKQGDKGVQRCPQQEFHYLCKAAQKKHPRALVDLANDYYLGKEGIVKKDVGKARAYLEKAAEQNYAKAFFNLAVMAISDGDVLQGIEHLKKASKAGSADAAHELGTLYYSGVKDVPQDLSLAFKWFSIGAQRRNPSSLFNKALCLKTGLGCKKDLVEAFVHFKAVADNYGDAEAQNEVGTLYANGEGVELDYQKAALYFEKAAKQGHERAKSNLEIALEKLK